ncbi:MAG: efflux RND transporter periplasmic adaptor subunit [Planctomycetota bacterium]
MKKISVILSLLLCLVCLPPGLVTAQEKEQEETDVPNIAESETFWPAVTLPFTQVVLSSKLDENITDIRVEEGDRVEKDDVVLEFDARQIDAQIEIMRTEAEYEDRIERKKTEVDYLEREYKRSKELASGDAVISESQLDEDRTQWELGESELKDLKRESRRAQNELDHYLARKNDYVIKSPVDGVVAKIRMDEGEMAREGEEVMEIVDPDQLEVRVHLPEDYVANVQPGQQGVVRFPCVNRGKVIATVYFVSPYVDSSSGTFLVKAWAEDESRAVIPGMGCDIKFNPFKARAESDSSPE